MNGLKPCLICNKAVRWCDENKKDHPSEGDSCHHIVCDHCKYNIDFWEAAGDLEDFEEIKKVIAEAWNSRDKAELEHCCQLLIENGISTGHGDSFTDLIEECIANVLEIDPWRKIEYAPEGDLVLVKIYIDQGMGHGHIEYKELTLTYGLFLPVPEGNIANVNFLAWQPIAEIPA